MDRNPGTGEKLFRRHVPRPRLTRLLDNTTSQVILITGPAGYGKTTLAEEWLQGRENAVWYRATSASADLAAFAANFSEALDPICPGAGNRLRQRLRIAEAPETAARPLAELLAEDLATWPNNAFVVLDDYHHLAGSNPVEEFFDWLLLLSPIKCVVTSRRLPRWASARRILYGEVTEISRTQLAMTPEEAAWVLGDRSSESVRSLVARAEGWPALIGLASLCASSEVPEERVSEELFRYFAEEVLRGETSECQAFILRASLLPAVTREGCAQVLGLNDADALIEELSHKNILQNAGAPGEFRFHPLLREFLRRKFKDESRAAYEELAATVIDFSRIRHDWEAAFELAIDVGKLGAAAQLVGDASADLLAAGRLETVEKWLQLAGAAALKNSAAILARAQTLMRRGRAALAETLAADLTGELPSTDPLLSRAWALRGEAMHFVSRDEAALELHLHARRLAKTQDDLLRALWGAFLAATVLERSDSSQLLNQLEEIAPRDVDSRLRIATGRVIAAAHRGSYSGLDKTVEPLIPLLEEATEPLVKTSFLVRAADVFNGQALYSEAKRQATTAAQLCIALRLDAIQAFCTEVRAGAELGLREFRSARRSFHELRLAASRSEDPYLDLALRILTLKRELSQSRQFHSSGPFERFRPGPQRSTVGEFTALLAIAAAARGDSSRAGAFSERARETTTGVDAHCYANAADVIASVSSGPKRHGLCSSWVNDCSDRGFLHAIVLAYRAYPPLLHPLLTDPEASDVVIPLVRQAGDVTLARKLGISFPQPAPALLELLTPRELEVFELLAAGLSNQEIAQKLFISLSTAKVHVHHIYEKTGARSRAEAVVKAKDFLF